MADVVANATDPTLAAIKLAWWRDRLEGRGEVAHLAAQARGLRAWVTNEWEHDGVNASGDGILSRLMDMTAGRI